MLLRGRAKRSEICAAESVALFVQRDAADVQRRANVCFSQKLKAAVEIGLRNEITAEVSSKCRLAPARRQRDETQFVQPLRAAASRRQSYLKIESFFSKISSCSQL